MILFLWNPSLIFALPCPSLSHSLTHSRSQCYCWDLTNVSLACEIIHLSTSTPRYLNTVVLLAMFKLYRNITRALFVVYFLWLDDVLVNWPVQCGASQLLGIPGVIQQGGRSHFIIRQKKGQRYLWCNITRRRTGKNTDRDIQGWGQFANSLDKIAINLNRVTCWWWREWWCQWKKVSNQSFSTRA